MPADTQATNNQQPRAGATLPSVYYAIPTERAITDIAFDAFMGVAMRAGAMGYGRIRTTYMSTDKARDKIVQAFMCDTGSDENDCLVMLDADQVHPSTIVEKLSRHDPSKGVVGALSFKRGNDFAPLFFFRNDAGRYETPVTWNDGELIECDFVAPGGICIRRWVFEKLLQAGVRPPFFRYMYEGKLAGQGEDTYFATLCIEAGIKHYVDTSVKSPHLTTSQVTIETWKSWVKANPERFELDE